MTDKTILDIDPLSGAIETAEYDEDGDRIIVNHRQDVTKTLELNKARQNDGTNSWTPSRDMVLQAEIPVGVAYEWLTKYGVNIYDSNHMPAVKRLLNSGEYRYLRCSNLII